MADELDIRARLLLLKIIETNGSIDDLYNFGYQYFQITQFLKKEIEVGNAVFNDGILEITELGMDEKRKLMDKSGAEKIDRIVLPQISMENKSFQIGVNEIFIPSKDELPF